MDEVNEFFDFSKPYERVIISTGSACSRISVKEDDKKIVKREICGNEYAKSFQSAEEEKMMQDTPMEIKVMDELEELDDDDDTRSKIQRKDDPIYDKYNFERYSEVDLPITDSKQTIINKIRDNKVVILQGETGCGKTTQVPQYILNDAYQRREYCNILCTQPRRIAAISIANRVASERKWDVGSVVGYQVGLHADISEDTRLLYCTTGILLHKLIQMKTMASYTHIILDEVHERDQDMDFLLIVVRKLLTTNSPNTKVILMSATINAKEFSEYFRTSKNGLLIPAPILKVDTRRLYTVKDFYLNELDRLNCDVEVDYLAPGISDGMYKLALKLIAVCEKLDSQCDDEVLFKQKPSILVFLPGMLEIDTMEKTMQKLKAVNPEINLLPLRLHSMITNDEQQRVFKRPPPEHRKVILSTNIAESSITVPDVKYVIDFCLTKSLVTDTSTNLTSLALHWSSRSSCKQRAGRAGRVMNGRVYRLVSKDFYDNHMDEFDTPEMARCPLENVVLKAKLLDMGPPHSILALAMSPPNLSDIGNTILILKESGALYKTVGDNYENFDGDLTFIGRVMESLPLNILISRLVVFGYIFSVLEESIIMAAGLNVQNIFEFPYNNKLSAYIQKLTWADGSGSDLFAILRVYKVWCSKMEQRDFEDEESEKSWARRYFINTRSMREMHLLVRDIKDRLSRFGLKEPTGARRVRYSNKEKTIILKIVIAGAFYPNYFLRSASNHQAYEKDSYKMLSGRDPCTTVYFSGFDSKYIGQLYVESIKKLFDQCGIPKKNINVKFCSGSEKILVTFLSEDTDNFDPKVQQLFVAGRVRSEVFKAIKMRSLRYPTQIKVMSPHEARAYAESLNLGVMNEGKWTPRRKLIKNPELIVLPSLYTNRIEGYVTHVVNCAKFWFQPFSEQEKLKQIEEDLNNYSDLEDFKSASEISKGQMVAAPFLVRGKEKYYRARIISLVESKQSAISFRVIYIDYGNYNIIQYHKLRKFGLYTNRLNDLPPRVFECYLAELQPSIINYPSGHWPNDAIKLMQSFVKEDIVTVEVYSVVNGIAAVILHKDNINLNEKLIKEGYAQHCEENYMAKLDHDVRIRKQLANNPSDYDIILNEEYLRTSQEEEEVYAEQAPPPEKCKYRIDLRGPRSPLETSLYSATRSGGWKKVRIEHNSVNSVLLNTDPQDFHERLLVASTVTENKSSNILTARNTTLMPNIHGFAPLMALIFCPTMEIRRDPNKTKYVSILTGLGFDSQNQPMFSEHDIVFKLDVNITALDLEKINQIRYCMDTLLYTHPGQGLPEISEQSRIELSGKIKSLIIDLLEKKRSSNEVYHSENEYMWNQIDKNDILTVENVYKNRSIFPLHFGLRLYDQSFEYMENLRRHCAELHGLSQMHCSIEAITCKLCNQSLDDVFQIRIHLLSQLHRNREQQIGFTK